MTNILIANIGNRDVWVAKDAPIPGDVHPGWNKDASYRALGKALQSRWPEVSPHLQLPIIGKALAYARQQSGSVDRVVLIASDQPDVEGVSQHHLAQDTCQLAPVAERLLVERYGVDPPAVTHRTVRGNPADYGVMQGFFRDLLPGLLQAHPDGVFYLEVSGGTPAMTSMLLTVGAEVFGLQARPLYVSQHQDEPFSLDLGRRTVAESLQDVVREDVAIYSYHAAAETVRARLDLLRDFVAAEPLLAVLEYARQRVNFNFEKAWEALSALPPEDGSKAIETLRDALHPTRTWWLLHEIVHNAELRLRVGDYGDFLVRLFRFDEAARRHAALTLGARFVDWDGRPDRGGEVVDPAWLRTRRDVDRYLGEKGVRRSGEGTVRATRFVLNLLVAFLAREQGQTTPRTLRKKLDIIDRLSGVRNSSFAVHTFDGVTARRMAKAFTGDSDARGTDEELDEIVATLREACKLATGRPVAPVNPYDDINALILDILDG